MIRWGQRPMAKKAKRRPRPTVSRRAYLGGRTREQRLLDDLCDVAQLLARLGTSDEDHDALRDVVDLLARTGREVADRLAAFQKGRGSRPPAWQAVARGLHERMPRGPRRATRVWDRLVEIAGGDHEIINEAVTGEVRSSCREIVGARCAGGPHLHCLNRGSDRLVTVSRKRVLNFLGGLRAK